MSKLIGYARVSTRQQSTDRQRADLLAAGVRRDDLYVDHGVSGARASRPEFDRALEARDPAPRRALAAVPSRERIERGRASGVATVASLASSGESVLVLSADALWRRGLVERAADPARFGGGGFAILAARGSIDTGLSEAGIVAASGGVTLADWPALELAPQVLPWFTHVVLVDPAPHPALEALAQGGGGYLHILAEARDPALSRRALDLAHPAREALAASWRSLSAAGGGPARGPLELRAWRDALCGRPSRSPEAAARVLRVLLEMGVVRTVRAGRDRLVEVVSSVRGELADSASFADYREAYEESLEFLSRSEARSSSPSRMAA